MYASLVGVIVTKFVDVVWWKKLIASLLTVPQFAGFFVWVRNDDSSTRKEYLSTQYYSYVALVGVGLFELIDISFEYFMLQRDEVCEKTLAVTGISFVVYGLLGMFLLMSFQDYSYFQSQIE